MTAPTNIPDVTGADMRPICLVHMEACLDENGLCSWPVEPEPAPVVGSIAALELAAASGMDYLAAAALRDADCATETPIFREALEAALMGGDAA